VTRKTSSPRNGWWAILLEFLFKCLRLFEKRPGLMLAAFVAIVIGLLLPAVIAKLYGPLPPKAVVVIVLAILVSIVILAIFAIWDSKMPRRNREPPRIIVVILNCTIALFAMSFTMTLSVAFPTISAKIRNFLPGGRILAPAVVASDVGKSPPEGATFNVNRYYVPSGKVGDIGDVTIKGTAFLYVTKGQGPHEYEWKYEDDGKTLSTQCAQFAGVIWLSPSNCFGTEPDAGYDLRGFKSVKWRARSTSGPVEVEFFIGGITWIWTQEDQKHVRKPVPYPDSMPRTSLGTKKLTPDWQEFDYSLAGQPDNNLKRVVGAFGWTANWGSNGVEANTFGTGSISERRFEIEIPEIRYEK
jgi:hypothetical protein